MKKSKRIVIICEHFPPAIGGSAVYFYYNCSLLNELGYDLKIISAYIPKSKEHDKTLPYKLIRLKTWRYLKKSPLWKNTFFNRFFKLIIMFQIFFLVLFSRCNILWLGSIDQISLFAIPLKLLKNFKLISSIYGEEFRMLQKSKLSKNIIKIVLQYSEKITTLCDFWKKEMVKFGLESKKISILPICIDKEIFKPTNNIMEVREKIGIEKFNPVLLTIARLVPRKGIDTIIKCLPELKKKFPNILYLVVGDGEYYNDLIQLVQKLSLIENVKFITGCNLHTLTEYYQSADIFVHPNREIKETGEIEGFGIVFIEANACGTPTIGGNSGGTVDAVLDGKTGFLVDSNNLSDIIEKIELILTDTNLRNQMKHNAIKWAQNFTKENIKKILQEITNDLLS